MHHYIHKYFKSFIGWGKNRKVVYRCALPDCSHYVFPQLVLYRSSLCWRCNKEFVLPKALSLLTSRPWCPECTKLRRKKSDPMPEKIAVTNPRDNVIEVVETHDLDSFIDQLIGGKK